MYCYQGSARSLNLDILESWDSASKTFIRNLYDGKVTGTRLSLILKPNTTKQAGENLHKKTVIVYNKKYALCTGEEIYTTTQGRIPNEYFFFVTRNEQRSTIQGVQDLYCLGI